MLDNVKEGDYVFIQFGHNDEVPTKKTYTTEDQFKNNLTRMSETRSKKAIPVLLTPMARRKFDSTGKIVGTHDVYSQIVREVAKQLNVPLIDIDKKTQVYFSNLDLKIQNYCTIICNRGNILIIRMVKLMIPISVN